MGAGIVVMKNDADLLFFMILLMTFGKRIFAYHLTLSVFRPSKAIVAIYPVRPKRQAIIFLEVATLEVNEQLS